MRFKQRAALLLLISLGVSGHVRADSDEHEDHDEGEPVTTISSETAIDHGITTSKAGPATLRRTVKTYGRVVVPSNQISHIRARFSGLITDVAVDVGDRVQTGELLMTIEANASLKRYLIKAPISGLVTQRHANAGEVADEQALLTLVDTSTLWVELRVFEGQLNDIRTGQPILISSATQKAASDIETILPSMDEHPFMVARVQIDNTAGVWSPGMFVEGDVVVEEVEVPLSVLTSGLQNMSGEVGVFVTDGQQYEFQPVVVGRSDGRISEVLRGLEQGARYVAGNSFLVKSDIEKSSVEDEH